MTERNSDLTMKDVAPQVREVIHDLTTRQERDPVTGKFVTGTLAAGSSLQYSETFWSAVEPLKDDILERLARDLALDTRDVIMTLFGTMDAYAEAHILRKAMFVRLTELGGPVTAKGKARSLFRAYLSAMDRELKLAQVLGFERRTKHVDNFIDAVTQAAREAQE